MKWICAFCKAINPQLSFKCHNCDKGSGAYVKEDYSYDTGGLKQGERFCDKVCKKQIAIKDAKIAGLKKALGMAQYWFNFYETKRAHAKKMGNKTDIEYLSDCMQAILPMVEIAEQALKEFGGE